MTDVDVVLAGRNEAALTAGTYALTVEQTVTWAGQKDAAPRLTTTRTIEVTAPRFALTPPDVVAVHPPPGSSGSWERTLPHLTAADDTLPWSRPLATNAPEPWLALLVLTDDDAYPDPATRLLTTPRQAGHLAQKAPQGVLFPRLTSLGAADTTSCSTVDVKLTALRAILPERGELKWLTHVRGVEASRRQGGWEEGRYSVVVANRFPRTPGRYTAVLVSLEGFADYDILGGKTPVGGIDRVRMVALWSWTFQQTAGGPRDSFTSLANRLAEASKEESLLRLPRTGVQGESEAARQVRQRLEGGWVPISHNLPTGEHVPGWYRGPFTPVPAASLPGDYRVDHPDRGLAYLKTYGMYDVSYAVAHTFGRMLALANPALLKAVDTLRSRTLTVVQDALLDDGTERSAREEFAALVSGTLGQDITDGLRKKNQSSGPARGAADAPAPSVPHGWTLPRLLDAFEHPHPTAASPDRVVARARAAVAALVAEHAEETARFLAQAKLLSAVPFDHLVPREEMLPGESVRFFHVDRQWLDAAVAGALATGAVTSTDTWVGGLLREHVLAGGNSPPAAGVLVRSLLVRAWPRLVVEATKEDGSPMAADDLATSRPLPDVLLVLLQDKPGSVTVREPPHGLSLGISTHKDTHQGTINLRAPRVMGSTKPGELLNKSATGIDTCMRADSLPGSEVLRVSCASGNHLVGKVGKEIPELTEAALALQLVDSAGYVTFTKE
ncbi:hypothetical protein [Streptomyces albus]|uniref:hypothetical protein n=1 Tax=Streptomyces albus TaxID=1888 RepID=UPI003409F8FA